MAVVGGWFNVDIELVGEVNANLALVAVGLQTNRVSLMMQKPVPRGTTIKHLQTGVYKFPYNLIFTPLPYFYYPLPT